jgi:hypothetical protein
MALISILHLALWTYIILGTFRLSKAEKREVAYGQSQCLRRFRPGSQNAKLYRRRPAPERLEAETRHVRPCRERGTGFQSNAGNNEQTFLRS